MALSKFLNSTKCLGPDLHIIFLKFTGDDLDQWVANKCADKVDQAFVEVKRKGRGVAAFICEPCFVSELLLYLKGPSYKLNMLILKIAGRHVF